MVNLGHRVAYDPLKRVLDVCVGAVAFVVTIPVQLVVAVLVLVKLGRPIFFRHPRPGRDGKIFTLLKFRTMAEPDPDRGLVSDEQRLTGFGKKMRATSLDELPTLLNVLAGHMSIVGPRPLHVHYLPRYSAEQARRHEVRPGITGLAQINGRNAISWADKLALDVQYVDSRSLRLDTVIILRTITMVIRREGISEEGQATASEFLG